MKKVTFLILLLAFLIIQSNELFCLQDAQSSGEYVILLHGLTRSYHSMEKLEKRLENHGYSVINLDYPSRKYTVEYLADKILNQEIEQINNNSTSKIHFVTHSMGGIVVRYYLKYHKLPNLGRVVMLSPPNQGSELIEFFRRDFLFRKIMGPAVLELGTKKDSLPLKLGPVDFELGVIAGNRSLNPMTSMILRGPDDGVVSVERTKVSGMDDFLVLRQNHTFIMRSEAVIEEVIYFLKNGVFRHAAAELGQSNRQ